MHQHLFAPADFGCHGDFRQSCVEKNVVAKNVRRKTREFPSFAKISRRLQMFLANFRESSWGFPRTGTPEHANSGIYPSLPNRLDWYPFSCRPFNRHVSIPCNRIFMTTPSTWSISSTSPEPRQRRLGSHEPGVLIARDGGAWERCQDHADGLAFGIRQSNRAG